MDGGETGASWKHCALLTWSRFHHCAQMTRLKVNVLLDPVLFCYSGQTSKLEQF